MKKIFNPQLITHKYLTGCYTERGLIKTMDCYRQAAESIAVLCRFSRRAVLISLLGLSAAFAAGPPPGEDPAVWCEQNADECSEWCADNVEAEICQEPECD